MFGSPIVSGKFVALAETPHSLPAVAYAVVDNNIRLEAKAVLKHVPAHFPGPVLDPFAVEPDYSNRSIIPDQFFQLAFHIVLDITVKIRIGFAYVVIFRVKRRLCIGMVPVHYRMIEAKPDSLLPAFLGKFRQDVTLKRCGINHIIVGILRVPQAKPVVVLAGNDDILHPCILCYLYPLFGIEFDRIKLFGERLIFRDGDFSPFHNPLTDTRHFFAFPLSGRYGIKAPMDKHAEPGLAPPAHPFVFTQRIFPTVRIQNRGCSSFLSTASNQ